MLYLARHGESKANLDKVYAGQKGDSPLTFVGEEQAQRLGERIVEADLGFSHIVSSPLERAKRTAHIVAEIIGLISSEVQIDDRLSEYDMGILTGKPIRPMPSREFISVEGTEDVNDFHDRVMASVEESRELTGSALIVAHAGVWRIIESSQRGLDLRDFRDLPLPPNGSLTEI